MLEEIPELISHFCVHMSLHLDCQISQLSLDVKLVKCWTETQLSCCYHLTLGFSVCGPHSTSSSRPVFFYVLSRINEAHLENYKSCIYHLGLKREQKHVRL